MSNVIEFRPRRDEWDDKFDNRDIAAMISGSMMGTMMIDFQEFLKVDICQGQDNATAMFDGVLRATTQHIDRVCLAIVNRHRPEQHEWPYPEPESLYATDHKV